MLPLLFVALQSASPADMAQADQMNTQFVGCLFGFARQARTSSIPANQFATRLDHACSSEERALRSSMNRVLAARGLRRGASAKIDDVIHQSRQAVVKAYERVSSANDLR